LILYNITFAVSLIKVRARAEPSSSNIKTRPIALSFVPHFRIRYKIVVMLPGVIFR